MLDVACVGIVVADCVARPVLKQPQVGQLELVDTIGLYSGGSAANTGYDLARLGIRVSLIGRIGTDGFGDFLEAEAQRVGCDSSLLKRDSSTGTSSSLVIVTPDGERTFLHSIGANAKLTPNDVPLLELKNQGVKILHLAGFYILTAMEGEHGEPATELFKQASSLGMITSLDCVWDATGRWGKLISSVLAQTDIFYPSIHEARAITGLVSTATPQEIAQGLFEMGVRQIVALKMGAEGSFVMTRDGTCHTVKAPKVKTIDGTGAGDAFIAGFLAAYLRGMKLLECAQFGNAAGALCVGALGATAGVTNWETVQILASQISE
jgi:sugar/nucleoside kinase (ribokinase family)